MVVAMHSPMPIDETQGNGIFLASLSYFTTPCIGLLFMISGALLLPVSDKYDAISFLKKRLSKVLGPTLFWTAFYILFNVKTDSGGVIYVKQYYQFLSQHKDMAFFGLCIP